MVFRSVCSAEVVFCSGLVVFYSGLVVFYSGLVVFCSTVVAFCSVCSSLVVFNSAVEVFCPVSSAWWALVPSAPPWWAPVPSALPWWAPVPSAPPWWAPVPSTPPWLPALLTLPRSPANPLPRGPGPPSLPLFRLCSTALLDCIGASGSRSLGGGGGYVMNLVYELPLTPHQRSLAHHMDSCTTLTVARHLRLQFPSSIVLTTHTADCTDHTTDCTDHTPYIYHGLPLPLCQVLYSVYHSPSDSYSTEPTQLS